MKFRALLSFSLASLLLTACNGVGPKDELVARIGSENFYQADLDYIALGERDWDRAPSYREAVYKELSRTAVVSKLLSENPNLEAKWKAKFPSIETRLLTLVYQRYFVMNNMMFTEDLLKKYYQTHQGLFAEDSTKSFLELRSKIAERLFFETYPDSIHNFRVKWSQSNPDVDTLQADHVFLEGVKREWTMKLGKELREKYNVQILPIPTPDAKAYYDAHKSDFMTPPSMVVYHIQSSDSSKLAKMTASLPQDSAAFMDLATKFSENKETAAHGGLVGKVKKDYALPYGIGVVNGLFEAFDGKDAGSISPVLKVPGKFGTAYHVFYLASKMGPEQKSFDRAKKDVEVSLLQNNIELDSSFVLATLNGEPVVRERDVLEVYAANKGVQKSNTNRERIVDMLADGAAFAADARANKLEKTWEYQAAYRDFRRSFMIDQYGELNIQKANVSEDTLKAIYEKLGNPIAGRLISFEDSRKDLVDFVTFPKNLLLRAYYYGYGNYGKGSIEDARKTIVAENIRQYRVFRDERMFVDAWNNTKFAIYRDNLNFDFTTQSPENLIKASDSLYKAKRLELAIDKLKRLRLIYPEQDSLFAWATFQIAQMESESDEDYDLSQAEYHAFYAMNPDHPDAEKAMFSRGFILDENLQREDEALEVLEAFQQKYPKSELKESVDWLVENIKSNGKLADDLMKKISEE